ncbi:MAG: hypothetical protein MJZ30_10065 [Paludibacteraceae bacterium]|nr:hypothetical protein [Paludibacteraceae bacterium]
MNRELDITNLLDNVRTSFENCTSINYTFVLYDRKMELKNKLQGSSTTANKQEKAEQVLSALESYLQRHPEIAKVDADFGGRKVSQRTNTSFILRSNDDETTEELRNQLDEMSNELNKLRSENDAKASHLEQRMEAIKSNNEKNEKVDIENTDYTAMMGNTIQILTGLAGIPDDCVDSKGQITQFGLGKLMERKIKEDIEKNNRITKIEALSSENERLKSQIEEMRKEYQRMEDELEQYEEYQRQTEPLLEELQSLRTKSGLISAGLGNVLGNVVGSLAQKYNLGALLGVDNAQQEQPAQQPQPQTAPQVRPLVRAVDADEE